MKIPGTRNIKRIAAWLQKMFTPRGLILMYHRVGEVGSDPWGLCVTPQHFAEHLEIVQKYGHPIRLQQLAQAVRDRNLLQRAVVVTFDDGYADNLYNAKPLLERYGIPATIFVTTGYIDRRREFWWDELDRLLLQPGTLPETLCLRIRETSYTWELGEASNYSKDDHLRFQNLRAWEGNPGSRHFLYYSLWQLLQPLPADEQQKLLDEIRMWASAEPIVRPTHRPLLTEELYSLGQADLIEIGAHTVTHPFLSAHSANFQQEEVQQSKTSLESILERGVISFSYPFGSYTTETTILIREAGFDCACSTVAEFVWRYTDCFQLPRIQVEDWDGEKFAEQLSKYFNG